MCDNRTVTVLQLADLSRKVAQEAKLLGRDCTDAEELRLSIVLGCIKHGLRKLPGGYDIVPTHMERLGKEYRYGSGWVNIKGEADYISKKVSLKKFLLQSEEAQFFSMSSTDIGGHRRVTLKLQALIPEPSQEMRALFPNVDWDPLPSLETMMTASSDEDDDDMESSGMNGSSQGPVKSVPRSIFNPELRQVGASCC